MSKFVPIGDPFDPERCTAHDKVHGQCRYKSAPGADTCVRHGANRQIAKKARERHRMYLLQKWKNRVEELSNNPEIKNLHDEIGIVRMMLEEVLNQCGDGHDLILSSRTIISCVDKIQKLVETVDRMDARHALPPATLVNLAGEWVKIINVYVQDPEVLDELADKLISTVEHVGRQQTITQSRPETAPSFPQDARTNTR